MRTTTYLLVTGLWTTALSAFGDSAPLRFELNNDSQAVALQFDVRPLVAGLSFTGPAIANASSHFAEVGPIASGATRFLVYSDFNTSLSTSAVVAVTLNVTASSSLVDGVVAVENLIVADASGQVTSASPNARPLILSVDPAAYAPTTVGSPLALSAQVVDVDGSISSVALLINDLPQATFDSPPFAVAWTPPMSGSYDFTVLAEESPQAGPAAVSVSPTVLIRAYDPAEVTDYGSFAEVHFGSDSANPLMADPGADPFGNQFKNLVAYFLGFDPRNPDLSHLPRLERDPSGGLIYRFLRSAYATDLEYSIDHTADLRPALWSSLTGGTTTETDLGDGTTEVSITLPPFTEAIQFLQLNVHQTTP